MKTYPIAGALCGLALTLAAAADTFVMKDGSKYAGSILRETATSYVLKVQVTKSIKDERVIAKADVVKIERQAQPVPNDFAAISGLTPVPDLQAPEEYAKRIRTVEKYLVDHRMTAKYKDAEVILATLKTEQQEIGAGAIKLDGKLIAPAEYKTNAYDVDARIAELKIRKLVKDGQYLLALRAFSGFQSDFRNTTAYSDLAPLISQVITSHVAEAAASLASFEARVKQRNAGLTRMSTTDRRTTESAIRQESADLDARFKSEKDAKLEWVTLHPFCRPALEDTVNFAKLELGRLAAIKNEPAKDGGKIFRDAMTLIQSKGGSSDAKPAILTAITGANNAQLPQRYISILEAAVPGGVPAPNR